MSSLLDKPDGMPIPGTEGTITAAQQADLLGLKESPVKPAEVPLTPAEARLIAEDRWPDESLRPPDYAAGTVCGADAVAAAMGVRPDDLDAAPLGSQPEGQPIQQPAVRPKLQPREPTAPTVPTRQPMTPELAAELRAQYTAYVAKVRDIANSAKESGDAARQARATREVRSAAELGEALKRKGVL